MKWCDKEIEFLKKYYELNCSLKLVKYLNRQPKAINQKARKLGLKKKIKTGFEKGHEPWNKGIDYKAGGRSLETQFKKGNIPHTWKGGIQTHKKKNGELYLYKHVETGKRIPLHRYNWIKKYGEIPAGMILRCRDGDTTNCNTDNWELISRADNFKRNENRPKAIESFKKKWERKRIMKKYFDWYK